VLSTIIFSQEYLNIHLIGKKQKYDAK